MLNLGALSVWGQIEKAWVQTQTQNKQALVSLLRGAEKEGPKAGRERSYSFFACCLNMSCLLVCILSEQGKIIVSLKPKKYWLQPHKPLLLIWPCANCQDEWTENILLMRYFCSCPWYIPLQMVEETQCHNYCVNLIQQHFDFAWTRSLISSFKYFLWINHAWVEKNFWENVYPVKKLVFTLHHHPLLTIPGCDMKYFYLALRWLLTPQRFACNNGTWTGTAQL